MLNSVWQIAFLWFSDAVLPSGRAGFVPHTLPESAASTPVADVTNNDALQTGQRHPLSIQLQLW